jgi:DNA-binding response OmpR family regulator
MFRILLLTKCPHAELSIEETILKLGHEVFCSSSLLKSLKYKELSLDFLYNFQIILLSETIPNREVEELLIKIKHSNSMVVQIVDIIPDEAELLKRTDQGICAFLPKKASLEGIRETLSFEKIVDTNNSTTELIIDADSDENDLLRILNLTTQERKLLQELIQVGGNVLSREDLCRRIWMKEPTSSTRSQLSSLIKRIKQKMDESYFDSNCVKTVWGKGYLFDTNNLRRVNASVLP